MVKPARERPPVEGSGVAVPDEAAGVTLQPQPESIAPSVPPAAPSLAAVPASPPAGVADDSRREVAIADRGVPVAAPQTAAQADDNLRHTFEAISVDPNGPTIAMPVRQERRTAHLAFRVTPDFLDEVRRRTHLLAAMHGLSVESVNIFIIQQLGASFELVNDRIKAHLEAEAKAGGTEWA